MIIYVERFMISH